MTLVERRFEKKGWGRIFVSDPAHVEQVKAAIREVDAFEFDYMPEGLVVPYEGKPDDLIYTHKFEIDINALTAYCWERGVWVWCVGQRHDPHEILR